jgi:hypothetical protein
VSSYTCEDLGLLSLFLKISIESFTSQRTIAVVNERAPEFFQSIFCPAFLECSAIIDFSLKVEKVESQSLITK